MRRILRTMLERIESGFDFIFGANWNPLYQLGTLGWFFFWIVAVSGIYLFIFFDSGVTQAYESVEYLTHTQWYAGGIMRSLHRYASDALVVVMVLHLLRECLLGRMRGPRWFAWVTGVPIIWLVFASGISGYWVVWDVLAQYVAIATTEWLDTLPIFGEPIARNFLHSSVLGGRFFTLMVFIHIAAPLILLFIMWIHIQRHMQPKVNPPMGLALGSLGMLLALSIYKPALSQNPANLDQVPSEIGLDWFYLFPYPLLDDIPGLTLWLILAVATFLIGLAPWLPPLRRAKPALVNLDNCNGCSRCAADCPYSAVSMELRSDGAAFSHEAVVKPELCVSCGICVGSCPTATPFRRKGDLVPGIDLPDTSAQQLRQDLHKLSENLQPGPKVIVFACEHGAHASLLADQQVGVIKLPCIGALPPPFIDYVLSKRLADGVVLAGCREGDCHFRFGGEWTKLRLARQRDPYLRERVPRNRIVECSAGIDQLTKLRRALENFRSHLPVNAEMETGATGKEEAESA